MKQKSIFTTSASDSLIKTKKEEINGNKDEAQLIS